MPLAQLGAEPWPEVELVDMELDAAENGQAAPEERKETLPKAKREPTWIERDMKTTEKKMFLESMGEGKRHSRK